MTVSGPSQSTAPLLPVYDYQAQGIQDYDPHWQVTLYCTLCYSLQDTLRLALINNSGGRYLLGSC